MMCMLNKNLNKGTIIPIVCGAKADFIWWQGSQYYECFLPLIRSFYDEWGMQLNHFNWGTFEKVSCG